MNKLRKKINFLQNGYSILTNMLYTKNFVTEGVLGIKLQESYAMVNLSRGIDEFANYISKELAYNRQEFTEIYDTFTSNELCKEYKEFMEKTIVRIRTLTVGIEEPLDLLFNSAMTRISSSMNDLVSNPFLMNMSNRDTFELMHNLLNVYYINWE